jgi:hypothetical protein
MHLAIGGMGSYQVGVWEMQGSIEDTVMIYELTCLLTPELNHKKIAVMKLSIPRTPIALFLAFECNFSSYSHSRTQSGHNESMPKSNCSSQDQLLSLIEH